MVFFLPLHEKFEDAFPPHLSKKLLNIMLKCNFRALAKFFNLINEQYIEKCDVSLHNIVLHIK